MCGIVALLAPLPRLQREELVAEMCAILGHRGPDGEGLSSAEYGDGGPGGITLGHRRLAILDLTPAAAQPMTRGPYCLTYNGEFYNYLEKRAVLEAAGQRFSSRSDTEVLLALVEQRGLPAALDEVNGMFAFALWNGQKRCLWLARDRFGEKPLYYLLDEVRRICIVASEIKAVLCAARRLGLAASARRDVVACYLAGADYEVGDATFFTSVRRVRPGELLRFDIQAEGRLALRRQLYYEVTPQRCPPTTGTQADEHFAELLTESLRLRLRSDVPVGACLSGGLDSSSLVCLAQQLLLPLGVGLRTFSAVHRPDDACDERDYIDAVVRAAGVENARTDPQAVLTPDAFTAFLRHHDEPVGGASVWAQHAVYRLVAAHGVRVALSGQGADECLTGYSGALPLLHAELLRRGKLAELARHLRAASPTAPMRALISALRLLGRRQLPTTLQEAWLNLRWHAAFRDSRYFCLSVLGEAPPLPASPPQLAAFAQRSLLHGYLYSLLSGSSLGTILRYEDRNSMAVSVEARAPFLDHRIVEHCLGRPPADLVAHGQTKALLRRTLGPILPRLVRERRDKIGFAAPEARWLLEPLQELVLDLLGSAAMAQRGLYNCGRLRQDYLTALAALPAKSSLGPRLDSYALWQALNIELWLREHSLSL